jgi:O-Antigen ligase
MKQAYRYALENHLHRNERLARSVVISETWCMARKANDHFVDKAVIFSLLFAAAMRDDRAYIAKSEWWSDLKINFVVSFLHEYSVAILILTGILIVLSVFRCRHFYAYLTLGPLIFLMDLLYAACRGSIEDPHLGVNLFIGFLFYAVVIFYCFNIIANDCTSNFVKILVFSMLYFSYFVVAINAFNLLTGNGFVPGNPRLFGTASHPNYMGVQFGLAEIVLLCQCLKKTSFIKLLLSVMMFLCGLFMLTLTGSRTGLLVFVVGSYFMLLAKAGFTARFAITALVGVIALVIGPVVLIHQFETGADSSILDSYLRDNVEVDASNRSEAWADLVDQIAKRPITGTGRYGDYSENSFLRGWAIYGLPYFLMFNALIIINLFGLLVSCRRFGYEYGISLLFGLFMGLIAGSIFEGYLVEIWGVPIIVWILLTVSSGMQRVDRQRQVPPRLNLGGNALKRRNALPSARRSIHGWPKAAIMDATNSAASELNAKSLSDDFIAGLPKSSEHEAD